MTRIETLQREIVDCRLCPRLIDHCRSIAAVKRRAYRDWEYWGRPVPSFGDPRARLLIVGLAPAAHGANRTGRMFTGDRSGDFLYEALHQTGFASQPTSTERGDGLELRDAWITAAVHCAPPGNKPSREEFSECRPYMEQELDLLRRVRVVVALGRLALDSYLTFLLARGSVEKRSLFPFSHGASFRTGSRVLLCSYHPSQQNTQTGRLTKAMLRAVFEQARGLIG